MADIRWLTTGQAAARMGVTQLVRRDRIPAKRLHPRGRWRIREDHLEAYQRQQDGGAAT